MNELFEFDRLNLKIPDGLSVGEGAVCFSGVFDPPSLKTGDSVRVYCEENSLGYFEMIADKVFIFKEDEVSFVPKDINFVSHNKNEMLKLGRGRIF